MSQGSNWHKENAARLLSLDLYNARKELPSSARVCPSCHHVFVPTFTTDRRCAECVAAAENER